VFIDWKNDGNFAPTSEAVLVDHSLGGFGAMAAPFVDLRAGALIRVRIGFSRVFLAEVRWCVPLDDEEVHFGCIRID